MHLVYFPYLHMGRNSEFNFHLDGTDIVVWNLKTKLNDYVADEALRAKITEILAIHKRDFKSRPIEDMGVVSIGDFDLRQLSVQEMRLCEEVRRLLFIGSVAQYSILERGANTGHYIATADNFLLSQKFFELSHERMAITSGFIVAKNDIGYRISEVAIKRPSYVPTPFNIAGDNDMMNTLLRLRKRNKRIYRRIMRAVDAMMSAYYNDEEQQSEQSRVLMLCSAMEILFDLPENKPRLHLKELFKRDFVRPTDKRARYKSQRGNGHSEWETESIQVMWADKFYSLRNKIIHGSKLSDDDFVFKGVHRHVDIAILFFVLGIRKVAGQTSGISPTHDEIIWEKGEVEDEGMEVFDGFVYERLDPWIHLTRSFRQ